MPIVIHPKFEDVTQEVSADALPEWVESGWLESKAPDAEDTSGRSDLGFVTNDYGQPVEPANADDLTDDDETGTPKF